MPRPLRRATRVCKQDQRAQSETQLPRGGQAKAAPADKELPSSSTPASGFGSQGRPDAGSHSSLQGLLRASPAPSPSPGTSGTSAGEGVSSRDGSGQHFSQDEPSELSKQVHSLVQFLMGLYRTHKPVNKEDMLKIVSKNFEHHFLEILKRATFSIEVVFGIDLKELDSKKQCYALVSKMDLPNNGMLSDGRGFPKTGLLMTLLGVIFMNGNCAREEIIWKFLNKMRIYAGQRHFIYGEPRKLITQDFVKLKYLEYRRVPNTEPAHCEFLWGPRAYAETTKMKVLEYFAKINNTAPSALSSWYEEALRDEEDRARGTVPQQA
ncbi:PREDICTED: melanoma-associated antigen B3-like, partial [Elephantulus edwardii]|uniref:melanoma-associated antigen B3-like n=1 Tax=Elephantulus edwardii TaxID=28737 RepID=UPI0003F09649